MSKWTRAEDAVKLIKEEWDARPLVNKTNTDLFSTIGGIEKQLETIYDNRGPIMYLAQIDDNKVEMKTIQVDNIDHNRTSPNGLDLLGSRVG